MLSILFVSDDKFPPFRVDTSVLIGEELGGRGHRIDMLLQSMEPCDRAYTTTWHGNNVWVGRTDNGETRLARVRKHYYWLAHQSRLFSMLRKRRYDLIQVKNKYLIAVAALLAARIHRTKFAFWLSYPFAEDCLFKVKEGIAPYPIFYFIKGHFLKFLAYRIIMPRADHVFVQSEQMKADIAAEGIDAGKLTPVPMGVSASSFDQYWSSDSGRPRLMKPGKKAVVYLGTIQRARKMDFMIRVLAHVLRSEPDTILYFVGDGEDAEDRRVLERLAESLGISESTVITGFLPREEAMAYVKNADVCVSPFYPTPVLNSTSPTKLVEYMYMEKAVVANDHPEQRLVLSGSGGGICVPYEEKMFSKAVVELLQDPKLAREMGSRGRRYVEKHRTYGQIASNLEDSYFRIIQST